MFVVACVSLDSSVVAAQHKRHHLLRIASIWLSQLPFLSPVPTLFLRHTEAEARIYFLDQFASSPWWWAGLATCNVAHLDSWISIILYSYYRNVM